VRSPLAFGQVGTEGLPVRRSALVRSQAGQFTLRLAWRILSVPFAVRAFPRRGTPGCAAAV